MSNTILAIKVSVIVIFLSLLSSCVTPESAIYKLYPGPEVPESGIATLDIYDAGSAVIDGHRVDYKDYDKVQLLPGNHNIRWTSKFVLKESQYDVILEGGHTYRLRSDTAPGARLRIYIWIEDITSGNVIAGTKKP